MEKRDIHKLSALTLILLMEIILLISLPGQSLNVALASENTENSEETAEEPYDGWFVDGDYMYYRNQEGDLLYGWQYLDGGWYYLLPDSGRLAVDCWVRDDDGIPCYMGGDGEWLYFGGLSWIGDSLSSNFESVKAMYKYFHYPKVVARALKCPMEDQPDNPSGITCAKGMVTAGIMENTLVFEMGTNNDWGLPYMSYSDKIDMLREIIGEDTRIILVTCYTVDDENTEYFYGDINREMRELAAENENIAVADWAAVCDPETDLNPADGTHLTTKSAKKYMKLIQDTLIDNFGPK